MDSTELLAEYDRMIEDLRQDVEKAQEELDENIELCRLLRKQYSGEWSKERLLAELEVRFWRHQDEKKYERSYQVDCLIKEVKENEAHG